MVDADDYEMLSRYKWFAGNHGYAATSVGGRGDSRGILMHRLILGLGPESRLFADHINHDRRCNLRTVTPSQSMMNVRARGGSSPLKGVHWHRGARTWRAMIQVDHKSMHIGYFDTEEAAARAYDAKARDLFGEFACLNFPVEQ
jgi:hypothetical protein